jgi:hypothetical protein
MRLKISYSYPLLAWVPLFLGNATWCFQAHRSVMAGTRVGVDVMHWGANGADPGEVLDIC